MNPPHTKFIRVALPLTSLNAQYEAACSKPHTNDRPATGGWSRYFENLRSQASLLFGDLIGGTREPYLEEDAAPKPSLQSMPEQDLPSLARALQDTSWQGAVQVGVLGYEFTNLPLIEVAATETISERLQVMLMTQSRALQRLHRTGWAFALRFRVISGGSLRYALLGRTLDEDHKSLAQAIERFLQSLGLNYRPLESNSELDLFHDPFQDSGHIVELRQSHEMVELTDLIDGRPERTDNYFVSLLEKANGDWAEFVECLRSAEDDTLVSLHLEPTRARREPNEKDYFARAADYAAQCGKIDFNGRRSVIRETSSNAPRVQESYLRAQEIIREPFLLVAQVTSKRLSEARSIAGWLRAATKTQQLTPTEVDDFEAARCTLRGLILTDWLESLAPMPRAACQRLRYLTDAAGASSLFRLPVKVKRMAPTPTVVQVVGVAALDPSEVPPPEPEALPLDQKRFNDTVKNHFPHHLAANYARAMSQPTVAAQCPHLLSLLEATLQYLGIVLMVDFLSLSSEQISRKRRNAATGALAGVITERPTNGKWRALIRGLSLELSEQEESFTYRLAQVVSRSGVDELLNELITARNHVSHGQYSESVVLQIREKLFQLLAMLPNLAQWKLICVDSVSIEGERLVFQARLLHGEKEYFEPIQGTSYPRLSPNAVLLVDVERKLGLTLDPWVVCKNCRTCQEYHLFYYVRRRDPTEFIMHCYRTRASFAPGVSSEHCLELKPDFEVEAAKIRDNSSYREQLRIAFRSLYVPGLSFNRQALKAGDTFVGEDSYEIDCFLARGGMAEIYQARKNGDETPVALKLLPSRRLQGLETIRRFEEEQRILKQLSDEGGHPGVIRICECGVHADAFYIAMEMADGWYAAGGSYKDLGSLPGPVAESQIVMIANQLAGALSFIHEMGIIHRDIKPSNILLFEKDIVKLSDFGIARCPDSLNLTKTEVPFVGTPYYLSPEHLKGHEHLRPASDLFSLGIVLFELCYGRRPLESDDPLEIIDWLRDPTPIALPDSDTESRLGRALSRLLQKDVEERVQTGREVLGLLNC